MIATSVTSCHQGSCRVLRYKQREKGPREVPSRVSTKHIQAKLNVTTTNRNNIIVIYAIFIVSGHRRDCLIEWYHSNCRDCRWLNYTAGSMIVAAVASFVAGLLVLFEKAGHGQSITQNVGQNHRSGRRNTLRQFVLRSGSRYCTIIFNLPYK